MDLDFDSSEAAILDHRQEQLNRLRLKRSYSLPKDLDSSHSDSGVNSGIVLDAQDENEVIKVANEVVARGNADNAARVAAADAQQRQQQQDEEEEGVVQGVKQKRKITAWCSGECVCNSKKLVVYGIGLISLFQA